MGIELTAAARKELAMATAGERHTRVWRRYQAIVLLAEGQAPAAVAHSLGCSLSSVYGWSAAWRRWRRGLARCWRLC